MKLVFMGTPAFSIPSLDSLITNHEVKAIVTKPDMPKGRHLIIAESEVKKFAISHSIPILQPDSLVNNEEFQNQMRLLAPEVIVVVAYGKIIPKWLIDLPPFGCVNLHASLLPEYRGAAPIQRAILDGKKTTGVTTMLLDEGMDTGDVLLIEKIDVGDEDDAGSLQRKLAEAGADLINKTLNGLISGEIKPKPQDNSAATVAAKIEKNEAMIDWEEPADRIARRIRAFSPFPGAYTYISGKRIKIYKAEIDECASTPGSIIRTENKLIIAAGKKSLSVIILQPEGKRRMTASEFLAGHPLETGDRVDKTKG